MTNNISFSIKFDKFQNSKKLQFKVITTLDYGATIDINSKKRPNNQ